MKEITKNLLRDRTCSNCARQEDKSTSWCAQWDNRPKYDTCEWWRKETTPRGKFSSNLTLPSWSLESEDRLIWRWTDWDNFDQTL